MVVSAVSLGDIVGILVCANLSFDVCTIKKPYSVVFSQSVSVQLMFSSACVYLCVCVSECDLKECDTAKYCASVSYGCIGT